MDYNAIQKPDPNNYPYSQYKTIDATMSETVWYKSKFWCDSTNKWRFVWSKDPFLGFKFRGIELGL